MVEPVKDMFRESVERCEEWESENRLLCCHWTRSVQGRLERKAGEGMEAGTVNSGRVADGS